MGFVSKVKDPAEVIDFEIDYRATTNPVLSADETIDTSTWTLYDFPVDANGNDLDPQNPDVEWVEATDINQDSDSLTDTKTKIWTSGGVRGAKYLANNHITTNEGRAYDQTFIIKMKEK